MSECKGVMFIHSFIHIPVAIPFAWAKMKATPMLVSSMEINVGAAETGQMMAFARIQLSVVCPVLETVILTVAASIGLMSTRHQVHVIRRGTPLKRGSSCIEHG